MPNVVQMVLLYEGGPELAENAGRTQKQPNTKK
jgi:hypothetical protein